MLTEKKKPANRNVQPPIEEFKKIVAYYTNSPPVCTRVYKRRKEMVTL